MAPSAQVLERDGERDGADEEAATRSSRAAVDVENVRGLQEVYDLALVMSNRARM